MPDEINPYERMNTLCTLIIPYNHIMKYTGRAAKKRGYYKDARKNTIITYLIKIIRIKLWI